MVPQRDPTPGQERLTGDPGANPGRPEGSGAPGGSRDGASGAKEPRTGSFEKRFEEQQGHPFRWKAVVKRAIVIGISGIALYLVAPSVIAVLNSWPKLVTLNLLWFVPALFAEAGHFTCTFALQRIALRTKAWFSVITAQLAGNAISLIVPGGQAAGAAVQFRMLSQSGMDTADSVGGLTAFSFLGIGGLLALPVFTLPVVLFGAPVSRGLATAAIVGAIGFVLFCGFGAVVLATDKPLCWAGGVAQTVYNRLFRRALRRKNKEPLTGLPERLLEQRDLIRRVLGQRWLEATLLSAGRLGLDYLCLLFCVRAVGSHPRPSVILLAYAVAGVIGLVPITPGGLGIVEASLTGLLIAAGLDGAQAVLATLAYRLASYWLPIISGPIAYAAFRHRYGEPQRGSVAPSTT